MFKHNQMVIFFNNKKEDICDEKTQISPPKRNEKGSFRLIFATAKSYLTSSLFTITYYLPKTSRTDLVKSEKVKTFPNFVREGFWRRHPDLNRGIRVLQTRALPLGYDAI